MGYQESSAVKEAGWIQKLLLDLRRPWIPFPSTPTTLWLTRVPSSFSIIPTSSTWSQHIDVAHHFACKRVVCKEVEFSYIKTGCMVADMLTNPLPDAKLSLCCRAMGDVNGNHYITRLYRPNTILSFF